MTAPLDGLTVLVACTVDRAPDLAGRLRAIGARVLEVPTIQIAPPDDFGPLDGALRTSAPFDWIVFTSRNGVRAFVERAKALAVDPRTVGHEIAVVGRATADATRRAGLPVAFIPPQFLTDSIPEGLGPLTDRRVLLPRADIARRSLAEALRAKGAMVTEVVAYRTLPSNPRQLPDGLEEVDYAVFTSASAAQGLDRVLGLRADDFKRHAQAACIGPVTADSARRLGYAVRVVATEHTVPGLLASLAKEVSPRA